MAANFGDVVSIGFALHQPQHLMFIQHQQLLREDVRNRPVVLPRAAPPRKRQIIATRHFHRQRQGFDSFKLRFGGGDVGLIGPVRLRSQVALHQLIHQPYHSDRKREPNEEDEDVVQTQIAAEKIREQIAQPLPTPPVEGGLGTFTVTGRKSSASALYHGMSHCSAKLSRADFTASSRSLNSTAHASAGRKVMSRAMRWRWTTKKINRERRKRTRKKERANANHANERE